MRNAAFFGFASAFAFVACGGQVDPVDNGFDSGATSSGDSSTAVDSSEPTDGAVLVDSTAPGDSSTVIEASIDSGAPFDGGSLDSGGAVDAGDAFDALCERLAEAICSPALQTCCSSRGVPTSIDGCQKAVFASCEAEAAQARSGARKFDPSYEDDCVTKYQKLTAECSIPIVDFVIQFSACEHMLPGNGAAGSPCNVDSDCAPGPGSSFGGCNQQTKTCTTTTIVGPGAPCSYAGSAPTICTDGYYCPFTGTQVCQAVTPVGSICAGPDSPECGLGNSCIPTPQNYRCEKGKAGGAACTTNLSCASWTCQGGKCTDPNVEIGVPQYCSGTP